MPETAESIRQLFNPSWPDSACCFVGVGFLRKVAAELESLRDVAEKAERLIEFTSRTNMPLLLSEEFELASLLAMLCDALHQLKEPRDAQ